MNVFQNDILKTLNNSNTIRGARWNEAAKLLKISSSEVQTQEEAVTLVKMRFLYDIIAKQCCNLYPQSLRLMFFRALTAINRLQNKYLTLTTITNISIKLERSKSYIQRIQVKTSELYFVESCLGQENSQ
jgi:hypothetical protein